MTSSTDARQFQALYTPRSVSRRRRGIERTSSASEDLAAACAVAAGTDTLLQNVLVERDGGDRGDESSEGGEAEEVHADWVGG